MGNRTTLLGALLLGLAGCGRGYSAQQIGSDAPVVTDVAALQNSNETYKEGEDVSIVMQFSSAVIVSGTPLLELNVKTQAGHTRYAVYEGGSLSEVLTFTYTVEAGDSTEDLMYLSSSALVLNGGSIARHDTGTQARLTLPESNHHRSLGKPYPVVIDAAAPMITDLLTDTASGIYTIPSEVVLRLRMSEAVTVRGTPVLSLSDDIAPLNYVREASDASTLVFRYVIHSGDNTADYLSITDVRAGDGVEDLIGHAADLTLPFDLIDDDLQTPAFIAIDTVAPSVVTVGAPLRPAKYKAGASLPIDVTFSERVKVDGTPVLTLTTGGVAVYRYGSGSSVLRFDYVIRADDSAAGLSYLSPTSLTGTIRDVAGTHADVNLTHTTAQFSGIEFDSVAPVVSSVTTSADNGIYTVGKVIAIDLHMSENVTVAGTPVLRLNNNGAVVKFAEASAPNVLTFLYTVVFGDTSNVALDTLSLSLPTAGTSIQDDAGNDANLAVVNQLNRTATLMIDTTPPASVVGLFASRVDKSTTLVWENLSDAAGFLVLRHAGTASTFLPLPGVKYAVNDNAQIVYVDTSLFFVDTASLASATYIYSAYAFDAAYNYSPISTNATVVVVAQWQQQAFIKGANAYFSDTFGTAMAFEGDTLLVGSPNDGSEQSTITNGSTVVMRSSSQYYGAAYVYKRTGLNWQQQAYLKAALQPDDEFGYSVALHGDTAVVGAPTRNGSLSTISNGPLTPIEEGSISRSGAAWVFQRTGSQWAQQAYLKASNVCDGCYFGTSVAIWDNTIVVGSNAESSAQTTISVGRVAYTDNGASYSGAAYVFERSGSVWSQQAYLKPSNNSAGNQFGLSVAIAGDIIVVGAYHENTFQSTITQGVTAARGASGYYGAAYVFKRSGTDWVQEAMLKPANIPLSGLFGWSVAISGNTVVVSAPGESGDSNTITNGPSAPPVGAHRCSASGSAYVFKRSGSTWAEEAYLKAPNNSGNMCLTGINFGNSVAIDDNTIVVGAALEASGESTVTNGSSTAVYDSRFLGAGAAYVFQRSGSLWSAESYLKAPNVEVTDNFGTYVAVSGAQVIVSAPYEDSEQYVISNGPTAPSNNLLQDSGAVYVFGD